MSDSSGDQLPLPQDPFGLPGIGEHTSSDRTHTPAGKKKERNRRREQQAKRSRKINRHK